MADVTKVKASDGTIYDINDVNDYTKDEVDGLLAGKADIGDSYTKAEEDALLADKADASDVASELALKANVVDVYSKTEADNLLAGKADVGVSYTKAEEDTLLADKANSADVYTITQTDGLLADKASVDDSSTTATMATWSADKLNVEFQNCAKLDANNEFTGDINLVSNMSDPSTQYGKMIDITDENDEGASFFLGRQSDPSLSGYNLNLDMMGDGSFNISTHSLNFYGTGEFNIPHATTKIKGHETIGFPDFSNVIHSILTTDFPYTVPSDGWIVGSCVKTDSGNSAFIEINGVKVSQTLWNSSSVDHAYGCLQIPVKAGDVLSCTSALLDSNLSLVGFR